jgi:Ca2+:H+ antiporter
MISLVIFTRSELRSIVLTVAAVAAAAATYYARAGGSVAPFVISGVALALLASLVGRSVEALGGRLGAGATGVLQSALGNLPELFVVLFALKARLYEVATATIVGSILANVLLVLGLAFVVGGAKNGRQFFEQASARRVTLMLLLSVAALVIPALTALLRTPAAGHERALSVAVSILLLVLFAASLPASVKKTQADDAGEGAGHGAEPRWPLWLAVALLTAASVAAAFVSDWFVAGLRCRSR